MNLPFSHERYKDKPIAKPWPIRTTSFRARRFLTAIVGLALVFWFCLANYRPSRVDDGPFPKPLRADPGSYFEDDLSVVKSRVPSGLPHSMDEAMVKVDVHPIRNVFYVLNGLTGTDTALVSLGCEMQNARLGATVNIIILGGGKVSIEEYRRMNHFGQEECPINFHDARAQEAGDYASFASNTVSYLAANHGPTAFIYTHSHQSPKPNWLLAALARHERETTQISLDPLSLESLGWMSYLGPAALNAWNKPRIDLVVDATSHAGSLNRLFKSLERAHYPADHHPNLIVTLEDSSSISAHDLIGRLSVLWPADRLIIRKRVKSEPHSMLEAWYPVNGDNFALFLNDQYDLSPYFLHYLKAMLLQYHYDIPGRFGLWRGNQLGISLQSLLAKETHLPETMKNFKNDINSIPKTKLPVLWSHTNLTDPLLLNPLHFTAFHEYAKIRPFENDLQDMFTAFVEEKKLVMMYPPNFSMDDGHFVLAQHYSDDTTQDPLKYEPDEAGHRLLDDKAWWTWIGLDKVMPSWSSLELYNAHNENEAMIEFFREAKIPESK